MLIFYSEQIDLEEAKAHEFAKLQDALHAMQVQVEEAKSMVVKEREAARKAIEEAPPVIKEMPVMVQDTEKINSLSAEVEKLRVCMLCFSITFKFFWFLCYALLFPCSNEHHCLQKYCILFYFIDVEFSLHMVKLWKYAW